MANTMAASSPRRVALARRRGTVVAWIEARTGLTGVGLGVVAAALGGLALGRALGSRALFLLVYGAVGVIGLAYVMGRRALDLETFRSELPSRAREGQVLAVVLRVTARKRLATVVLEEVLPSALGLPRRIAVPTLPTGEVVEHPYGLTPQRRGVYEVGPLVAEWSDPFGLTRRRRTILEPVTLIVHPTLEPSIDRVTHRAWEDPPYRPRATRPWPSGFEFYGMRDYVDGDDPRRIVWSATARTLDLESGTGRYLVREAEQGITDRVHVVLDTNRDVHTAGEPSPTFETAVRAAATLGAEHLHHGMEVTLHTGEEVLASHLRGRRSMMTLFDALAAVGLADATLTAGVDRLFATVSRSTHTVVITPNLDRLTAGRLRLMMEQGASLTVVLVVTPDTDALVLHRAGTLGCAVVELHPGRPLAPAFRHVVGVGR